MAEDMEKDVELNSVEDVLGRLQRGGLYLRYAALSCGGVPTPTPCLGQPGCVGVCALHSLSKTVKLGLAGARLVASALSKCKGIRSFQ